MTERIVRSTRVLASALLGAPAAALSLGPLGHARLLPDFAVALVCLAGLIAPVLAYHGYRAGEGKIVASNRVEERALLLRRVTLAWLGLSTAVALAGAAVYLLTGDLRACAGPVLHLLVGAAAWPTAARVARLVARTTD